MATAQETDRSIRISADEALKRLTCCQPVLVLDVRSDKAWDQSQEKIQGAIRVAPTKFQVDASWPRDRFTLTYCT